MTHSAVARLLSYLCRTGHGLACVLLLTAVAAAPAAAQRRLRPSGLPAGAIPPTGLPDPSYEGNIRELTGTDLVLQLDKPADVVKLRYSNKTEVYKDAKKVKVSTLAVGDRVSMIGGVDGEGFLMAKKITFERAGTAEETARIQTPLPQPAPNEAGQTSSLSDDSERPTLRRRNTGSSNSADSGSPASNDSSGASPTDAASSDSQPTLRRRTAAPADSANPDAADSSSSSPANSNSTPASSGAAAPPASGPANP